MLDGQIDRPNHRSVDDDETTPYTVLNDAAMAGAVGQQICIRPGDLDAVSRRTLKGVRDKDAVAAFKTADAAVHDEAFDVNGRGIQHLEHIDCSAGRIRKRGAWCGQQRQAIEAADRDVFVARA